MKNNIKDFRARYDFSQDALAEKLGVSRQPIISLKKGRYSPSITLAFKVARLFYAILINGAHISHGKFPEALMTVAIAIMCFCLSYLATHFAAKDEREQKIRERAVYICYFWGFGFAMFLMIIFNPTFDLNLAAFHILSLFMAFYISTVFLNMVYYARKCGKVDHSRCK